MSTLPPGSLQPRLWQTLRYARDSVRAIETDYRRYGDVFSMRVLGGENWVFLTQPADIKALFGADMEAAVAGENNLEYFEPLVGNDSVFVLDGGSHLHRRRLLLPCFQGERMHRYADLMRARTLEEIRTWPKQPFALLPRLQQLSLAIISEAAFGANEASGIPAVIRRLAERVFSSPFLFLRWLRFDWGRMSPWGRVLHEIRHADTAIYAEIAARRKRPNGDESILSLLLAAKNEDGTQLSDREIRNELVTMLVAGNEMSALALSWVFERVLSLPDVLARVSDEISGVDDPSALVRLPYLDAVVKETLRARPILPAVGNRRLKRPLTLAGYSLEPGTVLTSAISIVHHRPEIYPNPEQFLPDRFLGKTPDPYAWIAFGGGTRRCLGMHFALFQTKCVLATALRHARLSLPHANTPAAYRGLAVLPQKGLVVRAA